MFRCNRPLWSGAKLFAVLLLMAALPAWVLGQSKPDAPKPQPKTEKKTIELDLKDLKIDLGELKDFELKFDFADKGDDASKKAKDLEAKIAELKKQLDALRDKKTVEDLLKKVEPLKFRIADPVPVNPGPAKPYTIKIGPDQKAIELHLVDPTSKPKPDGAPTPGQPIRVERKVEVKSSQPQYKVIGPDGKEIKDAKVIVVDPKPAAPPTIEKADLNSLSQKLEATLKGVEAQVQDAKAKASAEKEKAMQQLAKAKTAIAYAAAPAHGGTSNVISLTRATYHLPKDKSDALAAFLKANVKTSVLEFKVEGDALTITTTPEAQNTIGGLVSLMAPAQSQWKFEFRGLDLKSPEKK